MDLKSMSPAARNGEARQEPEKRSANTAPALTTQADIAAASNRLADLADDAGVDTKSDASNAFGNDARHGGIAAAFEEAVAALKARAEPARLQRVARIHRVDTKVLSCENFGNDADLVGFIRVRKRKLKGGHRDWRAYCARRGILAATSMSFDLVRAVRLGGKPRHEFLLGLGSQKDIEHHDDHDLCRFWATAIYRMSRHELGEDQRRRLIVEMVRKGARLPTIETCEEYARHWPKDKAALGEIMQLADAGVQP